MPGRRVAITFLVGAILLDLVYWSLWFVERAWIASEHRGAYYEFENAFPLADLWLGLACALALAGLLRGWPSTLFWLVAAGSAAAYLACMDLLYDLEHGIFTQGGGGAFEACVVALTVAFAGFVLTWSWRSRAALLSPPASD